jgi:hypothetical protein
MQGCLTGGFGSRSFGGRCTLRRVIHCQGITKVIGGKIRLSNSLAAGASEGAQIFISFLFGKPSCSHCCQWEWCFKPLACIYRVPNSSFDSTLLHGMHFGLLSRVHPNQGQCSFSLSAAGFFSMSLNFWATRPNPLKPPPLDPPRDGWHHHSKKTVL